jgi:hypothetical protein
MSMSGSKIALGVGCGIVLGVGGLLATCAGCLMYPTIKREVSPALKDAKKDLLGEAPTPEDSAPKWVYSEKSDRMGRGPVFSAAIKSTNSLSLGFPYSGEQYGTLLLREHPKYGKDVILQIEKGQLLDSRYHSKVIVRFDNDKALSFSSSGPDDSSTESLFLRGAFTVFKNRLKTAKVLKLEAPIYQNGNEVFEFNVAGFNWSSASKSLKKP